MIYERMQHLLSKRVLREKASSIIRTEKVGWLLSNSDPGVADYHAFVGEM